MSFSCIVLCGGQSTRMGKNKAFIRINGELMVDLILKQLEKLSENIILVVDKKEKYAQIKEYERIKILEDENKNFGPVEGMRIGLKAMENQKGFICACDMPFIDTDCIDELYGYTDNKTLCVIPYADGKIHPLHGFYSKETVGMLDTMIKKDVKQIRYMFDKIETKFVERFNCNIENSVTNINDHNDLKKIKGRGVANGKRYQ